MANIRISQLPTAPDSITGSELVPIVQNGQTVQTTVSAITNSPSLTQTFLTITQESSLPNSRFIGGGLGIGTSNAGAQGLFSLFLNGTSASLENAATGIIVKSAVNTVVNRSIAVATAGLSVANGSGVSGNPTISLTGLALSAATLTGNGMVSLVGGSYFQNVTLTGTTNQISILNPNGGSNPTFSIADNPVLPGAAAVQIPAGLTGDRPALPVVGDIRYNTTTGRYEGYTVSGWQDLGSGDGTVTFVSGTPNQITVIDNATTPTVSLASNPIVPGTASIKIPAGTTGERPSGTNGDLRYNSTTGTFEGYANGVWGAIVSGSGVTSVGTGTGLLGGPITSTGTISIDTTVVATLTGAQTLTSKTISGSNNTLTNIGNASLTNSSVTYNGVTVSLGGSGTITATATNALTIGTGLSGSSYNGSTAVTIAIDSTVATLTGAQTLTNKTISGSSNTLTNIGNSSLTNSSITLGTTNIALGATSLAPAGLTSVTVTQDPTSNLQLATKQYVDGLISTGLAYHQPVQVATTQSLAAQTGGTVTYNAPGPEGVGATITLSVPLLILDGYTLLNTNRILVKNEVNQAYNGIYTWATGGLVLTRSTDADTYGPGVNQISLNDYFFVQNGTVNKGVSYVVTTVGAINFTTTPIIFAEFSTSQVYSAGTGLTLTGTTFSITNTAVTAGTYGTDARNMTLVVNAQGQITSVFDQPIAIAASQITSGTLAVAQGGTNIASYAVGDILYASGTTTLSKLALGTTNYVMTAGASAPQYVAQSTLSVGSATTATTATNVAGGAAGSIVYNSGAGATTFLALGTTNYVLTSGASAPQYVAQSTLSVGSATTATTATNLAGGAASQIPYQSGSGATSFIANGTAGQVLTSAGSGTPVWSGINGGTF
jgi:hypothetical protein